MAVTTDERDQPTPEGAERVRRPAILAIDDEPTVLAAVSRDLRRRFGADYRIVRAKSGQEALELLTEMRARGDVVALMVSDQRMPGMEGTEFLTRARKIYPEAKRTLLTAYADTQAAITAINDVDLDYYLLKPWDPPEEQLYPVVEDLLQTWQTEATVLSASGVRIVGHRFSRETHDLRDFIARNRVPGRWYDVERDVEAKQLLEVASVPEDRLPVVFLEDGSVLERPSVLELAERLGVAGAPESDHYDLVIVGGGPAGLRRCRLRRVGGVADRDGGVRGARRPGGAVESDRELPRVPDRSVGLRSGATRDHTGAAPGRRAADRLGRDRAADRGCRAGRAAQRRPRAERLQRARLLGCRLSQDAGPGL